MARILLTGVATIDIVHYVDRYPCEDDKIRAQRQRKQRGGNAANTADVLSQLHHQCTWCGSLSRDNDGAYIEHALHRAGVKTHPRYHHHFQAPTSHILVSQATGSRTVVHYRDLPELDAAFFCEQDLTLYDWLHFEGRHAEQTERMLQHAATRVPDIPRSLEVEKNRPDIERLIALASHVLFGKSFAEDLGFDGAGILQHYADRLYERPMACAWGSDGAYLLTQGLLQHQAALATAVVDSIGAGDTFNAGMIDSWLSGRGPEQALAFSQGLASRKLRQMGLNNLV